jgi:hypothetical protein
VQRPCVVGRDDRNSTHAEGARGSKDAKCDLAAIRYEHRLHGQGRYPSARLS